jgi:hypothetical protein
MALRNFEGNAQFLLGFSCRVSPKYFSDIRPCQFCLTGIFAAHYPRIFSYWVSVSGRRRSFRPTFPHHVGSVVAWGSKKQVIWVDAGRHVAGMANKHAFWYWPVFQFPRDAVGILHLPVVMNRPIMPNACRGFKPNAAP